MMSALQKSCFNLGRSGFVQNMMPDDNPFSYGNSELSREKYKFWLKGWIKNRNIYMKNNNGQMCSRITANHIEEWIDYGKVEILIQEGPLPEHKFYNSQRKATE